MHLTANQFLEAHAGADRGVGGTDDVEVGLVEQQQPILAVEKRDGRGIVFNRLQQQVLCLERHTTGTVFLGQIAAGAAIAEEFAVIFEQRHAADRPVLTLARWADVDVAEVAERPMCLQVIEMSFPLVGIGVAGTDLLAGLADGYFWIDAGHLAQALGHVAEPQIGIHLPEPVGGGGGKVAQSCLALAQSRIRV